MNIEDVVGCLPGAELGEVVDESTYKWTFKGHLGPISVTLAGTVDSKSATRSGAWDG